MHIQSDTLLLADILGNFRNRCIQTYEVDSAHILSAPGLTWSACLKKTKIEWELPTDLDMIQMVEKGIRGGVCHAIHWYPKVSNKYMRDYKKIVGCKQFIGMVNVSKIIRRQF